MTISEYFGDWLSILDLSELNKVVNLLNNLYATKPIVPNYSDIFKSFTLCSKKDCRVVFLGQDPYPQRGVATGVLFGNSLTTKDISPSLQIIRDSVMSLDESLMPFKYFDITMESWASQGILMINSALTCEMNRVGSHSMLWRPFISRFLCNLSKDKGDVIYVLFGNQAQTFEPYITSGTILRERHPAFYARINAAMPNRIFCEINAAISGEPIHWCSDV